MTNSISYELSLAASEVDGKRHLHLHITNRETGTNEVLPIVGPGAPDMTGEPYFASELAAVIGNDNPYKLLSNSAQRPHVDASQTQRIRNAHATALMHE